MSKKLNKKSESRKHAYALIFKLGYHDEVDTLKAFDYYLAEYIQEYIDVNLSDVYSTLPFEEDRKGLKTVEDYIKENLNKDYIYGVFSGTKQNIENIDSYIERFAKGWKLNRINKDVVAVLRLAIYEMLYMEDIPLKVSVQEAMNITKEYCGENSVKFVNGVLASVMKDVEKNSIKKIDVCTEDKNTEVENK